MGSQWQQREGPLFCLSTLCHLYSWPELPSLNYTSHWVLTGSWTLAASSPRVSRALSPFRAFTPPSCPLEGLSSAHDCILAISWTSIQSHLHAGQASYFLLALTTYLGLFVCTLTCYLPSPSGKYIAQPHLCYA